MHKNSFYVCVGGNLFKLEGQTKDINLSTLNHAETRNRAIIYNKNIEQMWPFFSYVKVNDSTLENKRKNN